jgi:diguanylate cyclase (GGDEF)-like protein
MAQAADQPGRGDGGHRQGGKHSLKEFARLNRTLKTLSAGNRTLLRATNEQELLHEMCRVIVETGGYRFASVGYAEHDAHKRVRWLAGVGIEITVLDAFHFTWADTELGQGATATAIRTGEPVVGKILLTDPAYAGPAYAVVRKIALKLGHASLTAFPLKVDGVVLGALAIASSDAYAFDDAEVELLSELAEDLAYGIANVRTGVQHRAAQATIARLAYFDAPTGLPNRTQLLESLEAAMDAARRRDGTLAMLHLEAGRFHEINKVLGYRAGDELLMELGQRLSHAIGADETLARVGDAEFALLLPYASADYAIEVAKRLAATLHMPVEMSGLMLDAQVGIGIAMYPGHATDADALFRRATAAMHQARPARGGYAMYTGGQEKENTRRLTLMGDLHRAIAHDELRLYCQPKVDFARRRVCGVEALVRWQHPQQGMISPTEFIPLAEQAGMITPLTNWMLQAAFRQSHEWVHIGAGLPFAINLSVLDLYDPELIDRIRGLFSTWGIAPELIEFELTESALMVDPGDALVTLTALKRLGVQLFIDDFGTGHSSLSYLQKLPVDAVKIDQSFVLPMVENSDSAVIVRSTIELSHNLGLKVVTEGVETQPIWECLAALECDVAQGYLISRPMPAQLFQEWQRAWRGTA